MITTAFEPEVHDRTSFDCGVESINTFLRNQATQWYRKGLTSCWVLESDDNRRIIGFYTLSAAALSYQDVAGSGVRQLPTTIQIPALRIGRLGVSRDHQGQGIGALLLIDTMTRSRRIDAAWAFIVVDAIDERAAAWYMSFGFVPIDSDCRRLVIARKTVDKCLKG